MTELSGEELIAKYRGQELSESGKALLKRLMWDELSYDDRLPMVAGEPNTEDWFSDAALETLGYFRQDAPRWGWIRARARHTGVDPWDLQRAVDGYLQTHRNGVARPENPHGTPLIVTFDGLADEGTEWLWWPYLPLGGLVMLDGDPGLGKSLLSTTLAAVLSRGWPLPDQHGALTLPVGSPADTLILSAEDSLTRTIKRRLAQAQADLTRVHALTGWTDAAGAKQWFTLQQIPVLEEALLGLPATRLIIIDPIQAYLGPIDMHRSNETRPLLTALSDIAERHRLCICCVRHPSKPGQGSAKAMHRGLGSVDFIGAARSGLFVEAHPVDETKVLLAQMKNNLDRLGRTQVFSKDEGIFGWAGVTRMSVETLAGSGRGPDQQVFLEAFCWLEQRLEGGRAWYGVDIEEEMSSEGYKSQLIRRVKKALGVVSKKSPDGTWTWRLPDLPLLSPPTTDLPASPTSSTSLTSFISLPREREPGEDDA